MIRPRLIGIEYTTDHRHPEYRIVRLTTPRKAARWLESGGDFAWPGAADETLPIGQQNFHSRVREVYVLPAGFRLPRDSHWRHHVWSSKVEAQVLAIWRAGTRWEPDAAAIAWARGERP